MASSGTSLASHFRSKRRIFSAPGAEADALVKQAQNELKHAAEEAKKVEFRFDFSLNGDAHGAKTTKKKNKKKKKKGKSNAPVIEAQDCAAEDQAVQEEVGAVVAVSNGDARADSVAAAAASEPAPSKRKKKSKKKPSATQTQAEATRVSMSNDILTQNVSETNEARVNVASTPETKPSKPSASKKTPQQTYEKAAKPAKTSVTAAAPSPTVKEVPSPPGFLKLRKPTSSDSEVMKMQLRYGRGKRNVAAIVQREKQKQKQQEAAAMDARASGGEAAATPPPSASFQFNFF